MVVKGDIFDGLSIRFSARSCVLIAKPREACQDAINYPLTTESIDAMIDLLHKARSLIKETKNDDNREQAGV